eukprot:1149467-Pleurochrysis_carterae.AAC.1
MARVGRQSRWLPRLEEPRQVVELQLILPVERRRAVGERVSDEEDAQRRRLRRDGLRFVRRHDRASRRMQQQQHAKNKCQSEAPVSEPAFRRAQSRRSRPRLASHHRHGNCNGSRHGSAWLVPARVCKQWLRERGQAHGTAACRSCTTLPMWGENTGDCAPATTAASSAT